MDVDTPTGQEVRVLDAVGIRVITQERYEDPLVSDMARTNELVTIIPLSINAKSPAGEKAAQRKGTALSGF